MVGVTQFESRSKKGKKGFRDTKSTECMTSSPLNYPQMEMTIEPTREKEEDFQENGLFDEEFFKKLSLFLNQKKL